MSHWIETQEEWTSQPQYPVGIDYGNGLTDGLVIDFSPSTGFDNASRRICPVVGNIIKSAGPAGVAREGTYQSSDNYVDLGTPSLPNNRVTLEVLCTVNAFQTTIFPYLSGLISGYDLSSPGPVLRFNPDATAGKAAVPAFILQTGNGATEYQCAGSALLTNTLYHILGTYDGTNLSLYVNGALAGQLSASITFDWNYGGGGRFVALSDYVDSVTGHNRCFNGKVFLARVYNKSKTAKQARDLADNAWRIYPPEDDTIWVPSAAGGATGTIAATWEVFTSSINGTTTIVGSLSQTTANFTSSITGTSEVPGTLIATTEDAAGTLEGTAGIQGTTGTITGLVGDSTASMTGTTTIVGTSATQVEDFLSAVTGTTTIIGILTGTSDNMVSTINGYVGEAPTARRRTLVGMGE